MSTVYETDVMKRSLYDFDVYPLVFLANRETIFTIKQNGIHRKFPGFCKGEKWYIKYLEVEKAEERRYPGTNGFVDIDVVVEEDGVLRFSATSPREGRYYIQIYKDAERTDRLEEINVYALDEDMRGKYPWRGDLHMHTCKSDGYNAPEIVAADYRGHGYDFTVISDHNLYYPSLLARQALGIENDESDITDFLVVQGEEVHLPYNDIHTVNFGGEFSVNALLTFKPNNDGPDKTHRSLNGECPDQITEEEYEAMIAERSKDIPLEVESERRSYAIETWICDKIREGNGLAIFAHPFWEWRTMQMSESYLQYVYKTRPFDAFEVLGGESYYAHNGFQTAFYYEMKAQGYDYPIVGSTDSHDCTKRNRNALICSTIVFAEENKTKCLIDNIKNYNTVAVDTISPEYRIVGNYRFTKYAGFLMENWYPLHDKATAVEGYYLRQYVTGDANAEAILRTIKGQIPAMMKKYFDIE